MAVSVILATVSIGYLAVPGALRWHAIRSLRAPVHTPATTFDPRTVASFAEFAFEWSNAPSVAPLLLTYHDITDDTTSPFSVRPSEFEAQMATLAQLGATSVSASEFAAYLAGGSLPPRSVMITFDDGALSMYRYADPILRRYGFRAVAFVITGFVGTAGNYYIDWDELETMRDSGRWEVESHAGIGHVYVPTDADGATGAFLATRQWLIEGRLETYAEYEQRITADLQRALDDLAEHNMGLNTMFSFPFSDAGNNNPDIQTVEILARVSRQLHRQVFRDSATALSLGGPIEVRRRTVVGGIEAMEFVELLREGLAANAAALTAA